MGMRNGKLGGKTFIIYIYLIKGKVGSGNGVFIYIHLEGVTVRRGSLSTYIR